MSWSQVLAPIATANKGTTSEGSAKGRGRITKPDVILGRSDVSSDAEQPGQASIGILQNVWRSALETQLHAPKSNLVVLALNDKKAI